MLYLNNLIPRANEQIAEAVAVQEAIRNLSKKLKSDSNETVLAACTGFSDETILFALKALGYSLKKVFHNEGVMLLEAADGSFEALLGYRPVPTADINKNYLILEMMMSA